MLEKWLLIYGRLLLLLNKLLLSLDEGLLLLSKLLSIRCLLRLRIELPWFPLLTTSLPPELSDVRLPHYPLLAVDRGEVEVLWLNLYDLLKTHSRVWI